MSFFHYKNYKIYYDIQGNKEGEPLIILNGLMMSTLSWMGLIKGFEEYKIVLVDFLDQGFSSRLEGESYDQWLQAEVVDSLIKELKLENVNLLGVSYGGEVGMKYAVKYGENLRSLILSNTAARTNELLKDMGRGWELASEMKDKRGFFKITLPVIYSIKFYEENAEMLRAREDFFVEKLDEGWYRGVKRLIRSAENHNVENCIKDINVPTLIIGSTEDILTPISQQKILHDKIKNSKLIVIQDAGHAAMYEKSYEWCSSIKGFMEVCYRELKI